MVLPYSKDFIKTMFGHGIFGVKNGFYYEKIITKENCLSSASLSISC